MSSVRQTGEPSVEEILQSIKQVIARENRGANSPGPRAAIGGGENAPSAPSFNDAPGTAELTPDDEPNDVLELTETEPEAAPGGYTRGNELLSERARTAMRDSLHTLASLAEPPGSTTSSSSRDNGIEALVRELLRPQLADWLDRNLPRLVEDMVAAEIARIVGRR